MSNTLQEQEWEVLLHRIKKGLCLPFLGAGACSGNLPLACDIARQWAEKYRYPLNDTMNLPRVAQYLAINHNDFQFPKERLTDLLCDCILPDWHAPDEPHGVLADLPLSIYMTTNYDSFMWSALKSRKRKPIREIARWNKDTRRLSSKFDSGFTPTTKKPVVFHLHGILEQPKSMVLTEDDYLDFLVAMKTDNVMTTSSADSVGASEAPLIPARIQEAFANSTLLFIGYGLSDWDFRVLFRVLVEYLERSSRRAHVSVQLLPESKGMTDIQKESIRLYFDRYYKQLQISVYWGSCREFVSELKRRWEAFNDGR